MLHAEISIRNNVINSFYDYITKHVEPLSDEEVGFSNVLIDLQSFEKWTKKNSTTITNLRIEKKLIDSLLKKKNDSNYLLIIINYTKIK